LEVAKCHNSKFYDNLKGKFTRCKNDHLKYRVDLGQALLVDHGGGVEGTVQWRHSTDKTVPRIIERHFPERIPPIQKK
jgi:hypothetical protein